MSIVARRYALALMNLASREKQVEEIAAALDDVAGSVADSPDLQAFLAEPKVTPSAKEAVVAELIAKAKVPDLLGKFLRFVTSKRRIDLLPEIHRAYHELADARMGRAHAHVTVSAELTAAQQKALQARLGELSGKDVTLNVNVDPDILGGVVARIDSTVWDGSLRNQLRRLEQTIASA